MLSYWLSDLKATRKGSLSDIFYYCNLIDNQYKANKLQIYAFTLTQLSIKGHIIQWEFEWQWSQLSREECPFNAE